MFDREWEPGDACESCIALAEDTNESRPVSAPAPAAHPEVHGCACCARALADQCAEVGLDLAEQAQRFRDDPANQRSPVVDTTSMLLVNAKILTMEPELPNAEAMLWRDGRIVWVGSEAEAAAHADEHTQRLDAGGRCVLPGFIEPHLHLAPIAMLEHFVNIGPFRFASIEAALVHLAERAQELPSQAWLIGRQFDPSLQEGPNELTAQMLDEVADDRPIFVYNASLHFAYCNSFALALAGITAATPDPPGAALGRDEAGAPNGVLKGGAAMALVGRHNTAQRELDIVQGCLAALRRANSVGFTTVCDQGTGAFQGAERELALYDALRQSNGMTARLRYSVMNTQAHQWDRLEIKPGVGDEWLRRVGWKIVSDGSNQGRTGLQREGFLGGDERGIAYIEPEDLREAVLKRLGDGWPVAVHANGDAAIDRVLDVFEHAAEQGLDPGARRCRIEHCSILHDEQIARIAALGLSPSFLIGHVHYWGKAFRDEIFGLAKASLLGRVASCEAAGVRWSLHSDEPVTEMGPLRCIENAVTRLMWKAPGEVLASHERIDVDAALRAMTIDAAWQCHSDHELGSLRSGKLADFVVLARDPREVAPETIGSIEVLETWVNGARVYARNEQS